MTCNRLLIGTEICSPGTPADGSGVSNHEPNIYLCMYLCIYLFRTKEQFKYLGMKISQDLSNGII